MVLTTPRERVAALGYDFEAQPNERVTTCNLCGFDRFVTIAHADRYGFAAKTAACMRCGLAFLSPRLTEDGYADFYRETYRPLVSAFHGRPIDARSVELDQAVYATALADALAPFLAMRAGGTLLDVGGSTGVVAATISTRFAFGATVLDPSPDELARATERNLETIPGTIEHYDPGVRRFDLVLLCQTIDHVLDVAGTLAKLRSVLTDDGTLFVDIVDFRAAYLRGGSTESATKLDHPYSLTEATTEAYLARAGLEVIAKDYAADGLHVGYVCKPAAADASALPPPERVSSFFTEIRSIQVTTSAP